MTASTVHHIWLDTIAVFWIEIWQEVDSKSVIKEPPLMRLPSLALYCVEPF